MAASDAMVHAFPWDSVESVVRKFDLPLFLAAPSHSEVTSTPKCLSLATEIAIAVAARGTEQQRHADCDVGGSCRPPETAAAVVDGAATGVGRSPQPTG